MPDYIAPAVDVDASQIAQDKIDRLQALIPGLQLEAGHILRVLAEVDSEYDAQVLQQASEVLTSVFTTFGEKILRVPRDTGVQATATSTWTFTDTLGRTIFAGTFITLRAADGSRVLFQVRNEVTIAPGSAATTAGQVQLLAAEPGVAANGLSDDPQPEETLTGFSSITLTAPTAGGEDAETDEQYLNRLADSASTLAYTLVLPQDFAVDARNNVDGIDRVLVLPGYDPVADTTGNPGVFTVVPIDDAGADPGAPTRTELHDRQQALVPAGVTLYVDTPDYTTMTITFTAVAYEGWTPSDVEARAEQAVLDFLDPAAWGLPRVGDQRDWINTPIVRRQDIITVLNSVDGFDYFTALTINGSTTADVTMTGSAPLPAPAPTSTVAGTVTAP